MKPAFFCPEIGPAVGVRLDALLRTLGELTNPHAWTGDTALGCAQTFTTIGNLGFWISEAKRPTFEGSIEDWALEVLGEDYVSNPNIKPALKVVFEAIGAVLTEVEDLPCLKAMEYAESELAWAAANHLSSEDIWTWAQDYPHPSVRDRRIAFAREVQEEQHDRVVRARKQNPSGAQPAKDLWPRERREPPILPPRPPLPRPPPPPPTPILPPEDLSTAGRLRLCEVLSHPVNLGLLGVERVDPAMPLNQLRALVRLLEGGAQ